MISHRQLIALLSLACISAAAIAADERRPKPAPEKVCADFLKAPAGLEVTVWAIIQSSGGLTQTVAESRVKQHGKLPRSPMLTASQLGLTPQDAANLAAVLKTAG